MALSLALVTGVVWSLTALVGLVSRQLLGDPRWDLWDGLRRPGVSATLPRVLPRRYMSLLLGDGYRQAVRARAAGDLRAACNLARAELAATRVVLEHLDVALVEYAQHLRVLQAVVAPPHALPPHVLHGSIVRGLVLAGVRLGARLRPRAGLWLRVSTLRLAGRLLVWRITVTQRNAATALDTLSAVGADAVALAWATRRSRRAVARSWRVSRALVADVRRPRRPHGPSAGTDWLM